MDVDVLVSRKSQHLLRVVAETSGRPSNVGGKTGRSANRSEERQRSPRWTLKHDRTTHLKFISNRFDKQLNLFNFETEKWAEEQIVLTNS